MSNVTVSEQQKAPEHLVINLGKKKKDEIRALKNGKGPIIQEIAELPEYQEAVASKAAIYLIYEKKKKRKKPERNLERAIKTFSKTNVKRNKSTQRFIESLLWPK